MTDVNGLTGIIESVNGTQFQVKGVLGSPAETTGGTVVKVDGGDAIRNGIYKVYDETNKVYCSLIRGEEFEENKSYSYGTVYSVSSDVLKINPSSCVSATVFYLKKPTDFSDSATECDLIDILEPILLDFAESELWNADNKLNQGATAYKKAFDQIQILNGRFALNE